VGAPEVSALAALNVGLYETHARQAGFIERADFNIIALDVAMPRCGSV